MNIQQAYERFERWPDRSDLPCRGSASFSGRRYEDIWPCAAVGACDAIDAIDAAQSDDDLRDGLARFVELRRADPLDANRLAVAWRKATGSAVIHKHYYEERYQIYVEGRRSAEDWRSSREYMDSPKWRTYTQSRAYDAHFYITDETWGVRRILTLTPAMARGILDWNEETRGLTLVCAEGCIAKFAQKIWDGEWTAIDPNPRTTPRIQSRYCEDRDGNLTGEVENYCAPGEHRLQAVCNAGRTIEMEFIGSLDAFAVVEQLAAAEREMVAA